MASAAQKGHGLTAVFIFPLHLYKKKKEKEIKKNKPTQLLKVTSGSTTSGQASIPLPAGASAPTSTLWRLTSSQVPFFAGFQPVPR